MIVLFQNNILKNTMKIWLKFIDLRILESQVSQRHPSLGNVTIKYICGNGCTLTLTGPQQGGTESMQVMRESAVTECWQESPQQWNANESLWQGTCNLATCLWQQSTKDPEKNSVTECEPLSILVNSCDHLQIRGMSVQKSIPNQNPLYGHYQMTILINMLHIPCVTFTHLCGHTGSKEAGNNGMIELIQEGKVTNC